MRKFVMPLLIFLALWPSQVWAQTTAAEESMNALVEKVKADKKQVVAENMVLTDAEASVFWPIYEDYQRDLTTVNERLIQAISNYADAYKQGPLPDEKAELLIGETIAIEQTDTDMLVTYAARLSAVLPSSKVVRYLQIEHKIRAAVRFGLAENVPLAE